jgi:hypothetical protein
MLFARHRERRLRFTVVVCSSYSVRIGREALAVAVYAVRPG